MEPLNVVELVRNDARSDPEGPSACSFVYVRLKFREAGRHYMLTSAAVSRIEANPKAATPFRNSPSKRPW